MGLEKWFFMIFKIIRNCHTKKRGNFEIRVNFFVKIFNVGTIKVSKFYDYQPGEEI